MMEKLTVDQVEEGHGTAFVKALLRELRERRERVVSQLSEAGWGVGSDDRVSVRCGRLAVYDEAIRLIVEVTGKETET